jgi:hypothetical protein
VEPFLLSLQQKGAASSHPGCDIPVGPVFWEQNKCLQ